MSFGQGLTPEVLRAIQLKELGRYADAEQGFREGLAKDPNNGFLLHELAVCQLRQVGKEKLSLETARQAISIQPNEAGHHVLLGFILCQLDRPKEALKVADEARALDPNLPAALVVRAQAFLQQQQWANAEAAARAALALDADDQVAANQLAQALRLQNKLDESAAHIAGMLSRDPEDPYTHSTAGWRALQANDHKQAEQHFREALRLQPNFENAREGLLTSFHARSGFYRIYLKWCFFIQQFTSGQQWMIILGLYVVFQFAKSLKGPWQPLGTLFIALYLLFALWTRVARSVGNLFVLIDQAARYALRPFERLDAMIVGGSVLVGVPFMIVGAVTPFFSLTLYGAALICGAFPGSMVVDNKSTLGRWIFGGIAGFAYLVLLLMFISDLTNIPPTTMVLPMFVTMVILSALSSWFGNVPALHKR